MARMTRWIGLSVALAGLLLTATTSHAQSQADRSAQEPQVISNEVVVDPFDQPPPRRDTSRSASSAGDDTMDPNGVSPSRQLQPVNES
jgi:hypothetical protein